MKTFKLTVQISEDDNGRMTSEHSFQTDQDCEIAKSLSSGGHRQAAVGLFTEGLRRETFLEAALLSGADPNYLSNWTAATEPEKREIEKALGLQVQEVLGVSLNKLSALAAREMLEMVCGGPPADQKG